MDRSLQAFIINVYRDLKPCGHVAKRPLDNRFKPVDERGGLSTEVVIFSFQALLSTALSGSYSQGLIHRKARIGLIPGEGKPLKQTLSARH